MKRVKTIALMLLFFSMLWVCMVRTVAEELSVTMPVHNINTGLNYPKIQKAIDAPETLAGHTIVVDAGNYTENVDVRKSLTLVGAGAQLAIIVPPETDDTIDVTADNVTIQGFTINVLAGYSGVLLDKAGHCDISYNIFIGKGTGILLRGSSDNTLSDNKIYSLPGNGIDVRDRSERNKVSRNVLNRNHYGIIILNGSNLNVMSDNFVNSSDVCGIRLNWLESSFLSVAYNNITNNFVSNNDEGIFLDYSSTNNFVDDNTASNNHVGIRLRQSNNNTVAHSTLISNVDGAHLESSTDNVIYDNFFNNTNNAWDNGSNFWNTTKQPGVNIIGRTFVGGNYWSDFHPVDVDNDGIGDVVHGINGGTSTDYLPLRQSWIEVHPLEYDSSTRIWRIRFEISPDDYLYQSILEVNKTRFDQIDLTPRSYYEEGTYGLPRDPMVTCTTNVSEPKVPMVRICLAVPPDFVPESDIADLEVEHFGTMGKISLIPVEKYDAPMSAPKYEWNQDVYGSYEPYPAGAIMKPQVESLYGFKIVTVEAHPLQYVPAANKLLFYKMRGSITFRGQFQEDVPRKVRAFDAALKRLILNYYDAKQWSDYKPQIRPKLQTASLGMAAKSSSWPILIVSANDFVSQAAELKSKKENRANRMDTWVATVNDIVTWYQLSGGPSTNVPTMIRDYIQYFNDKWNTEYVILLGDMSIIGLSVEVARPTCNEWKVGTPSCPCCAQSITLSSSARGIITADLLVKKKGNPPPLKVAIRGSLSLTAPDLVSFEIQPSELPSGSDGWQWVHKHFNHSDSIGPSSTYYLFVYADNMATDQNNYYIINATDGCDYEPTGLFHYYDGTNWIGVLTCDMIFRSQLYTDDSVPVLYTSNRAPCDYYYACLHGILDDAWDPNRDGYYADPSDTGIDFGAQEAVGRLPATSNAEAETMVTKIGDFEALDHLDSCHSALLWFGAYDSGSGSCYTFGGTASDVRPIFNQYVGPSIDCWNSYPKMDCTFGDPDDQKFKEEFNIDLWAAFFVGHGCYAYTTDTRRTFALEFDGIDDYVYISNPPKITNEGTIELWFEKTGDSGVPAWPAGGLVYYRGAKPLIYEFYDSGTSKDYIQVYWAGANGMIGHGGAYTGKYYFSRNTWHHLVFTWTSQSYQLYLDGQSKESVPTGFAPNYQYEDWAYIGRYTSMQGWVTTHSIIDEARVYNRALTPTEAVNHYNGGSGTHGQCEPGLVAGWHFDERDGAKAYDYSGHNVDGTIYGATHVGGKIPHVGLTWERVKDHLQESYSVVYAASCYTGGFDLNPDQKWPAQGWYQKCLAESFLVYGKALAYIGSMRDDGLGPYTSFWQHYFTDADWRVGDALNLAKHGTNDYLMYQLFGDPETYHWKPCNFCPFPASEMVSLHCLKLTNNVYVDFRENVTFAFKNIFNSTIYLSNVPFGIIDPSGNTVYSPPASHVTTPVKPGESISWTWDQTMLNGSLVETPGKYLIQINALNFTKQMPFYILEANDSIFTDSQCYSLGKPVTFGFRNLGDKPLTVTVKIKRSNIVHYEVSRLIPAKDDMEIDWTGVSMVTGHLSTGEYLLEAAATDASGSTKTYTKTFTIIAVPPCMETKALKVPMREDINGDYRVNIIDIAAAAAAFGSYPGHPRWNAMADTDNDLKVNIIDITIIARQFGKEYDC